MPTRDENIWQRCRGADFIGPMKVEMVRIVEAQEDIATLSLVDNLDEQHLLESLLEKSKPGQLEPNLHYLLASPFRYPPLLWGSRFGRAHERALFYGSTRMETALAECAFYRLVFIDGVSVPFPQPLVSQHTSFWALARAERAADLTRSPYDSVMAELRAPDRYSATQILGSEMRSAGVMLFTYRSARDDDPTAINAAAFSPDVFKRAQPTRFQSWTCYATADAVRFISSPNKASHEFSLHRFLVNERLPMPPPA